MADSNVYRVSALVEVDDMLHTMVLASDMSLPDAMGMRDGVVGTEVCGIIVNKAIIECKRVDGIGWSEVWSVTPKPLCDTDIVLSDGTGVIIGDAHSISLLP